MIWAVQRETAGTVGGWPAQELIIHYNWIESDLSQALSYIIIYLSQKQNGVDNYIYYITANFPNRSIRAI